ncbi:MAG: HAD family acid phosphatase [bacterium]
MKVAKRKLWFSFAVFVLLIFGTTSCTIAQQYKPLPRDIKWVTTSVEYAALCTQTYRNAWQAVKRAARYETKNWVVVLDVDETVLDNSLYAVERTAIDSGYTEASWASWVFRKEATLVPGAKAFIDSVRTLGSLAHIAYITDRLVAYKQATIENLEKFDLFKEGDIILMKTSRQDTKEARRRCLETGTGRCAKSVPLVILALLGDNIRDFMPMRSREVATHYRKNKLDADLNWGKKYFMLPNPTYGSWERDYK